MSDRPPTHTPGIQDPRDFYLRRGTEQWNRSPYARIYDARQNTQNAPILSDDGQTYDPTGYPDFWRDAQANNINPDNFLEGWDYQNPPTTPEGVPLNYNNEPLPTGAVAWNPYGEPDFTPAGRTDLAAQFEGWFKGIQYRFNKNVVRPEDKNPLVAASEKAASYLEKFDFANGLPAAWDVLMQIGPGLRNIGGEEDNSPTALTLAGRGVAEVGRGIGSAFGLFAKTAESLIGTGVLTTQEIQKDSPLPEIKYPDWVPGWAEIIANGIGPVAAYNSLRTLTAPKKSWDEAVDHLDENWQASRIAYSVVDEPALKAEFIRRYKAGENPAYLQAELENPLDELFGQLIFDPLNVAGFFTKIETQAARLGKIEDIFVNPAKGITQAIDNLKAPSLADGAKALEDFAVAVQTEASRINKGLTESAASRGLLNLTTEGKRGDIVNRSGQIVRYLFASTKRADGSLDFDKAMEMMRAMLLAVDPNDLNRVTEGVSILGKADVPRPLLSQAGLEFANIMRNGIVDEAGKLDFDDFMRGFNQAKEKGLEPVIEWATGKLNKATTGFFPTIAEQVESARQLGRLGDVPLWQQAVYNFDNVTRGKIYTPINRFFANVYMGYSPGFAFRNLMNNSLTVAVDTGIPSLFVKNEDAVTGIKKLLGGVLNPKATLGIGPGASAEGVKVSKPEKWWQWANGLVTSQYFEESASARLSYKAVKDAMGRMLKPGRALASVEDLVRAGLSQDAAQILTRLVAEDGDVAAGLARFREATATGHLDISRTLAWLGDDDMKFADAYNLVDEIGAILKGEGSLAQKQEAIRGLTSKLGEVADLAKGETTGITEKLANLPAGMLVQDATRAGEISQEAAQVYTHSSWANRNAIDTYRNLINRVGREVDLAMRDAGKGDISRAIGEIQESILTIAEKHWASAHDAHKIATENMVTRLNQLKSGTGGVTLEQLWNEFKMVGDFPAIGMSRDEFISAAWENWRNVTRQNFSEARDLYVTTGETFWQIVRELSRYEPSSALLEQARAAFQQAKTYDDVVVRDLANKGPRVFQRRQIIASALKKGNTDLAIRTLAERYGIATATAEGVPFDTYLLNVLRKYGDDAATLATTTLEDAWSVFEARQYENGLAPVIKNLDEYLGRVTKTAEKTTANVDDAARAASAAGAAEKGAQIPVMITKKMRAQLADLGYTTEEVANMTPQQAWDAINATAKKVADDAAKAAGTTGAVGESDFVDAIPTPIKTPYMDGELPTEARMAEESLAGAKAWLEELSGKLGEQWGKLVPAKFTPEIETALAGWVSKSEKGVAEARLMASAYADIVRDFALHDYSQKRNVDLLASYLFPYHFWYSRTYVNWMKRLVINPEVIAAYSKYKTALEHLHAGAPEWWRGSINTNELFGFDSENPLFFNLEATLNPLNAITGVDFNDPARRVNWLTRTVDDMGKFGPSVWTPISMAIAAGLYHQGETDAAARWGGRLFPQTAFIRNTIGGALNMNIEVDPNTLIFAGGQDPYEQRRISRTLGSMADQGLMINGQFVKITDEQAIDAANIKTRMINPEAAQIWELATQYALDQRAGPQAMSFLFGVGFKGRTTSDIQIDKMYQEYYSLWNLAPNLTPDEFRLRMESLRVSYPWMDSVLIGRKAGPEVDRALAYNVLSRVPPGQSGDITQLFGIAPEIIEQFYQNKGDLSFMTIPDRDRFMAGIVDLSAVLALPADATRYEWAQVRNTYRAMQEQAKVQFGEDIWERVDRWFALNQANPDAAKLAIKQDPLIEAALNFKEQAVFNDELLSSYYGGLDFIEKYYNGMKYDALNSKFPEIGAAWDAYYSLKDAGNTKEARAFWQAHPELEQYIKLRDTWDANIEAKLDALDGKLNEGIPAELRPELVPQGAYQEPGAQALGYQQYQPTYQDYTQFMSPSQVRLLEDYFAGDTMTEAMKTQLTAIAENVYGMSLEEFLQATYLSYNNEQYPTP